MRARNIKPGFFKNELLGTEDPLVSILFIGLWCLADKEGILEDRPLRIKAEIFPYREKIDINGYLTVIQRLGFIVRYDGYIKILNFKKHQNPHHTEKESEFPQPTQSQIEQNKLLTTNNGELTVKQPLINRETPADSLIPDSIKDSVKDSRTHLSTLASIWNKTCVNLPSVKESSVERRKKEKARLKERDIETWQQIFKAINDSKFCTGNNDKNWVATYDWIIKNSDNSIKVLEGKYKDRDKSYCDIPKYSEKNRALGEFLDAHNNFEETKKWTNTI